MNEQGCWLSIVVDGICAHRAAYEAFRNATFKDGKTLIALGFAVNKRVVAACKAAIKWMIVP